jgi:hypothetical protein
MSKEDTGFLFNRLLAQEAYLLEVQRKKDAMAGGAFLPAAALNGSCRSWNFGPPAAFPGSGGAQALTGQIRRVILPLLSRAACWSEPIRLQTEQLSGVPAAEYVAPRIALEASSRGPSAISVCCKPVDERGDTLIGHL